MSHVSTHLMVSTDGDARRAAGIGWAVRAALVLFLVACVFDPADRLFGLKVDLFLLAWFLTAVRWLWLGALPRVHPGLVLYTAIFVLVPLLSLAWYWGTNGSEPFEGLPLLKAYLLMTLAILLFIERINLLPYLAAILTVLALSVIGLFTVLERWPELHPAVSIFGATTGIVILDQRDYGSGLVLMQIYFVTSPMLAISLAYHFDRWHGAVGRDRWRYAALVGLSALGMILAGTRNNLATAVLLPLTLLFLRARHKIATRLVAVAFALMLLVLLGEYIGVLLDPNEYSNNLKLALLSDYGELLNDPVTLLFGQGLGAYHSWGARAGLNFYVSELTYLELIRNFGAIGALVMFLLLVFPLVYVFLINRKSSEKSVVVGYGFYLGMCISNPNLFSSMGMLILAIVLANIFMTDSVLASRWVKVLK